jgi:hypothetical protein
VNSAELDDFGASEALPRVLVDDDPLNLELLTSFLRAEEYRIGTVQSGQEAIAASNAPSGAANRRLPGAKNRRPISDDAGEQDDDGVSRLWV